MALGMAGADQAEPDAALADEADQVDGVAEAVGGRRKPGSGGTVAADA